MTENYAVDLINELWFLQVSNLFLITNFKSKKCIKKSKRKTFEDEVALVQSNRLTNFFDPLNSTFGMRFL